MSESNTWCCSDATYGVLSPIRPLLAFTRGTNLATVCRGGKGSCRALCRTGSGICPLGIGLMPIKVLDYSECARLANLSLRTWSRIIDGPDAPPIIHITERRRGVLESDFVEWLESRRHPTRLPSDPALTPKRSRGRPRKIAVIPAAE